MFTNGGSISFVPSYMSKLKVSTKISNERAFTPKYEITEVGNTGDTRTLKTGYAIGSTTYSYLKLNYKVNDTWSVFNENRFATDGFYEARKDGSRVRIRTGISASLF